MGSEACLFFRRQFIKKPLQRLFLGQILFYLFTYLFQTQNSQNPIPSPFLKADLPCSSISSHCHAALHPSRRSETFHSRAPQPSTTAEPPPNSTHPPTSKTSIIFVMSRMHTYGDLWLHIVM
ncbi:hypothetical protein HanIR_Chr10g0459871 [Helianthus annuus]|nr:hypothetical protein HanIR_Chr10g0459871 [Helianthus annuus]